MTLKNKDIAEGMRVTNGKDVWKVLDWNSKYTDCLLQKIDKNGNKMDLFVVAENYELYGDEKEPQIAWMNGDYCIEKRQIDAEQYFVDFYKDNKKFKESKKSLKERSEENEIIVSELLDTVEYFCGLFEEIGELKGNALKDLKNAVERLEVFNAIGSIYQWGVEVLNKCGVKYKGMKESKNSIKEKISRKYKYEFRHFGDFEIVQFDDRNFEIYAVHKDTENVLNFKIEKTYVYEDYNDDICLFVGEVEELGWCFIAFDKHENDDNIYAYQYHENDKSWAYTCLNSYKLYLVNKKVYRTHNIESKKKSLKESAKLINEKNVAKFVDELNKWCDDNIHFADTESAKSTREFGKLYDFQYDWDYSFGDKGELLVWDNEGTLDWFEESYVKDFIVKLAKKYGWYCEPCHSSSDFMFAEL